jgi:dihydroxyacetone kinase
MSPPKKFINDPKDAVDELIQGMLLQYPNKLRKLQNHHVLLSSEINHEKVNLLSGGGSGHEPSHAGWIGKGMLTGAILGGIFASPSVASILAAIRAVTKIGEGKGVLLIVKNYTGDRLNFGMACEMANSEGRLCRMVIVKDDCALPRTKGITGARGVAGTVLVHKIAGGAAEQGLDLDAVASIAQSAADKMGSLGVALDAVTIPGASTTNDRLDDLTIEFGLGIHGEAGIRQSPLLSCNDLAEEMISTINEFGLIDEGKVVPTFKSGDEVAVLVNNLGGTSNFEMGLLTNSAVSVLEKEGCFVSRVYCGTMMSSFDMMGASLTILSLAGAEAENLKNLLDSETTAIAWPSVDVWKDIASSRPSAEEIPEISAPAEGSGASYEGIKVDIEEFPVIVEKMLTAAAKTLVDAEPVLTKYDLICGDGDCGLTMKRGGQEVLDRIESGKLDLSHPVPLFASLADAVSASMGGTSGVLLELCFRKMSAYLLTRTNINAKTISAAFKQGVEAISFYGGASVGSRTMLDALFPSTEALLASGSIADAAEAARKGADETGKMESASAGRANYIGSGLTGTPDPGAVAVALVLESLSLLD